MDINKLVIKRPQVTTVEKKTLILSLPHLGDISLQTRTKLRKPFKGILNCCKLQIVFKVKGNSLMLFINIHVEGEILPITVRQIDT